MPIVPLGYTSLHHTDNKKEKQLSPNFHLSGSADSEKRLQTTHSEQTAASWYKVKSRKEAATNLGGKRRPQPGDLVAGIPLLLDYVLPDIATISVGRNISGVATISVSLCCLASLVHSNDVQG